MINKHKQYVLLGIFYLSNSLLLMLISVVIILPYATMNAQEKIPAHVLNTEENIRRLQQQEETEELRRIEDERRRFQTPTHSEDKKKKKDGKEKLFRKGRQCVFMKTVTIKGDPFLSKRDHHNLVKDLTRRCLGPEEINYLIRITTNYYISRGYITTRVYIPSQDLNDGSFELQVVPGIIESIIFAKKKGFRSQIATAFPTLEGQRLNLRKLEQGLEQINRLGSNKGRMNLRPGKKSGYSKVVIDNQTTQPWHASLGVSNSGAKSTGEAVANGSFTLDSPLLLNDSWTLSGSQNIEGANNPENKNQYHSLLASIPMGFWTFSYVNSNSEYLTVVGGAFISYKASGKTKTENFTLDRLIYRSRVSKATLSLALQKRNGENFIEETRLHISSRKIETLGLDANYSYHTKYGSFQMNLGHLLGTIESIAGGERNQLAPDLRFRKWEAGINYSFPFSFFKQQFNWQSSYQFQYTANILHSQEQISIGGQHTIRGFREQGFSADIGYIFRNEIHWYPSVSESDADLNEYWGRPSFFMAYDYGVVDSNTRTAQVGNLAGIAGGINSYGKYGNFSITLSQSMIWPKKFKKERAVWFSTGFRL